MKVVKWLNDHFEESILIFLLVLISCIELIQVIFRNLSFVPALTWAEEFCRFCWIWSVFISLPYTIKEGSMLRVSLILDVLPEKIKSSLNIFVDIITGFAMIVLGIKSTGVVSKIYHSGETSPAMSWPMWIIYAIMIPGFFIGFLRSIQQAFFHIKDFNKNVLSTKEQADKDAKEEVQGRLK